MKKLIAILLACTLIFAFVAACAQDDPPAPTPTPAADADPTPTPEADPDPADPEAPAEPEDPPAGVDLSDLRIALVAHGPESIQFDGSFNEGSWNGIVDFLGAHGLDAGVHANFFQAHAADNVARVDVMADAVAWGADILILPGFHFAASVYEAAQLFPDVKFVVLDTRPDPGPEAANVVSIIYAEEQSGFLAGYAVVMEGFRDIGFMGGIAVPAVVRYGHGFIEGADYAARSLGLAPGDVTISYHYIGGFAPSPEVATMAGSWFAGGTEVIFAAAGGAGFSVISAAEDANAWMIGVDVDQYRDSETVLTSAMKALEVSVNDMLTDFINDSFQGGNNLHYNASNSGIGLPMANSRFINFSQADYDAIFAQLVNGSIVVTTAQPEPGGTTDPNEIISFEYVTVNFIS